MKHPMQPVQMDNNGIIGFKKNSVVDYLAENCGRNINSLALMGFSDEDMEQFIQLIGVSVSFFSDLDYASDAACKKAKNKADIIHFEIVNKGKKQEL